MPSINPSFAIPTDENPLVPCSGDFDAQLDRKLGYFGQERFVCFFYEPRGEEVVWKDCQSFGFGTGAWFTFMRQVKSSVDQASAEMEADQTTDRHVLVIDRLKQATYFAQRKVA